MPRPDRSGIAIWQWGRLRDRTTWLTAVGILLTGSLAGTGVMRMVADLGARGSDLPLHVALLIESRSADAHLGYSMYYALLSVVSGGSENPEFVLGVATIVLGVLIGLRLALTYLVLAISGAPHLVRVALTLALGVVMPLAVPGDKIYLGKFAAVVWHNSTTILAVPFCLVLFVVVCEYLRWHRVSRRWLHAVPPVALTLCILAKPNYALALLPAIGVLAVWWMISARRPQRAAMWRFLLARCGAMAAVAIIVLGVMYLLTFGGTGLVITGERVTLGVRPLVVWRLMTDSVIWATVASFALPAAMTLAMPRSVRGSLPIRLAWLTTVVAVAQFVFLAEVLDPSGRTLGHGNWMWGAQLSTFVLFVVVTGAFAGRWRQMNGWRWVAVGLGIIQVLLGIYFLYDMAQGVPATWVNLLTPSEPHVAKT